MKLNIFIVLIVSSLCGALSGYYAAGFSSVPAQIAIVDVQALIQKAAGDGKAQTAEDAKLLSEKIRKATEPLVERGIVVLEAQGVLNAPEGAYVNLD